MASHMREKEVYEWVKRFKG